MCSANLFSGLWMISVINMCVHSARCYSAAGPELIEVFVDDKPVMVDPSCTVLQVSYKIRD